MAGETKTSGIALGGGVAVASLIDTLIGKGILTHDEAIDAIKRAQLRIAPFVQGNAVGFEASNFLVEIMRNINKSRP